MHSERTDDRRTDDGRTDRVRAGRDLTRVLARLTAPDYLRDLETADAAGIRALRDECRAEERRLSYLRRMIQGHLDLAAAELAARAGASSGALIDSVSRTVTGVPWQATSMRAVGLYEPVGTADGLDDVATAPLGDLDDAMLAEHVLRLRRRERVLSDQRTVLLDHLDRLQDALVARYRDGRAGIGDVTLVVDGT